MKKWPSESAQQTSKSELKLISQKILLTITNTYGCFVASLKSVTKPQVTSCPIAQLDLTGDYFPGGVLGN